MPLLPSSSADAHDYTALASLYALRLALRARSSSSNWNSNALSELFDRFFGPSREADEIELDDLISANPKDYRPAEKRSLLRALLAELEADPPQAKGVLFDNAAMLGEALGMSPVEQQVIAFRLLIRLDRALEKTVDALGRVPVAGAARIIATALAVPDGTVEDALRLDGALARSGLLNVSGGFGELVDLLNPIDGSSRTLLARHDSPESLLAFAVQRAPSATLRLDDYPHLRGQAALAVSYLQAAAGARYRGVNILLHGEPGVGKTELARALSAAAGVRLYEVSTQVSRDEALTAYERCGHYLLNQSLFERAGDVAILFDEVEDVLGEDLLVSNRKAARGKAWTLKALESNPVPAFWIANSVRHVDPAILRRFDIALEVPPPPRAVRRGIFSAALQGIPVEADTVIRLAANDALSPAVVSRAAEVIRAVGVDDPAQASRSLETLTGGYLATRGRARPMRYPQPAHYSLDFVNASADLASLSRGLSTRRRGSILLYGPPGTGKTAFVHHLAGELDLPLETKRASDILGPYVGETEQNLARIFRAASDEGAVLFLDEADSFLRRREDARQRFEVTQVNELLTQIEAFGGILLCATNFVDNLDRAALRRFGATIRFDCLRPEQAIALFRQAMGGEEPASAIADALRALRNLTAGDFAAARNRWEMVGRAPTAAELVGTLREMCELKSDERSRPIGFIS